MLSITSNIFGKFRKFSFSKDLNRTLFKNVQVKNIHPCSIKLCMHANTQLPIIILNIYYFYLKKYLEIYYGYNLLFRKTQETVK